MSQRKRSTSPMTRTSSSSSRSSGTSPRTQFVQRQLGLTKPRASSQERLRSAARVAGEGTSQVRRSLSPRRDIRSLPQEVRETIDSYSEAFEPGMVNFRSITGTRQPLDFFPIEVVKIIESYNNKPLDKVLERILNNFMHSIDKPSKTLLKKIDRDIQKIENYKKNNPYKFDILSVNMDILDRLYYEIDSYHSGLDATSIIDLMYRLHNLGIDFTKFSRLIDPLKKLLMYQIRQLKFDNAKKLLSVLNYKLSNYEKAILKEELDNFQYEYNFEIDELVKELRKYLASKNIFI